MDNEKLYSSPRWHNDTSGKAIAYEKQSKEERIKSKKALLNILVQDGEITQEEADKTLEDFINNYK